MEKAKRSEIPVRDEIYAKKMSILEAYNERKTRLNATELIFDDIKDEILNHINSCKDPTRFDFYFSFSEERDAKYHTLQRRLEPIITLDLLRDFAEKGYRIHLRFSGSYVKVPLEVLKIWEDLQEALDDDVDTFWIGV